MLDKKQLRNHVKVLVMVFALQRVLMVVSLVVKDAKEDVRRHVQLLVEVVAVKVVLVLVSLIVA